MRITSIAWQGICGQSTEMYHLVQDQRSSWAVQSGWYRAELIDSTLEWVEESDAYEV